MRTRKIFIAVFMTALCLLGTMPLSISAHNTLFNLGDIYEYYDVRQIRLPVIDEPDDNLLVPVTVDGTISPIDINIIYASGDKIGVIDIIDCSIQVITGANVVYTETVGDDIYTSKVSAIQFNGTGDFIVYSPELGINLPRYFVDQSYSLGISYETNIIQTDSGQIIEDSFYYSSFLTYIDGEPIEFNIEVPNIKISIDSIPEDNSENMAIIIGIMGAFTPVDPFKTQLSYTTGGYSKLFSNSFSFIQEYAVISNPIIQISLLIMAVAICLLILKFLFDRR